MPIYDDRWQSTLHNLSLPLRGAMAGGALMRGGGAGENGGGVADVDGGVSIRCPFSCFQVQFELAWGKVKRMLRPFFRSNSVTIFSSNRHLTAAWTGVLLALLKRLQP